MSFDKIFNFQYTTLDREDTFLIIIFPIRLFLFYCYTPIFNLCLEEKEKLKMAGNNSIQILRGATTFDQVHSPQVLLDG